jgi:prolipoprotein diacylglyceryltransferase
MLELLAYVAGGRVYWRGAGRTAMPPLSVDRALLLGSAVAGAFLGSVLLHDLEHLAAIMASRPDVSWWSGKSVLGGLLGGTLAVECAKRAIGWKHPTGDAWVGALALGLIIGRAGCQLSGLWDQTFGIPTNLPWGWDYGDGVSRHPTALYEMGLVAVAGALSVAAPLRTAPGAAFAAFCLSYCGVRFGLEFLKPPFGQSPAGTLEVSLYAGLTAIQWAALAGLMWFGLLLAVRLRGTRLG